MWKNLKWNFILKWVCAFIIAGILIGATSFITYRAAYRSFEDQNFIVKNNNINFDSKADKKLIDKFKEIQKYIKDNFYLPYNENSLVEGSITGMVDGLGDPYTKYYNAQQIKERTDQLQGEYIGIGAEISFQDQNYILIGDVKDNTPAADAGIKPLDKIIAIDGKKISDYKNNEYWDLFAEQGKKIDLTLLRDQDTIEVELTVSKIVEQSVFSDMLTDNVGYIRISMFDAKVSRDYQTELDALLNKSMEKLVLDLRDNGGGLVSEMSKIASSILRDGDLIYYEVDKSGEKKQVTYAKEQSLNIPVVVLINENTASAAEILASALRDNGRVKLVGMKTYGKAVSQVTKMFDDGTGLVITISQYYTKSGYNIQNTGLKPDGGYEIESSDEYKNTKVQYIPRENDLQLNTALDLLKNG